MSLALLFAAARAQQQFTDAAEGTITVERGGGGVAFGLPLLLAVRALVVEGLVYGDAGIGSLTAEGLSAEAVVFTDTGTGAITITGDATATSAGSAYYSVGPSVPQRRRIIYRDYATGAIRLDGHGDDLLETDPMQFEEELALLLATTRILEPA